MLCRLGILSDLLNEDGSFSFPNYSLRLLRRREHIDIVRVPGGAVLDRAVSGEFDFLISVPTGTMIDNSSFNAPSRLLAILRVGVGCDDIDLAACTEAGVAVVLPTTAVVRPTAVAALTLLLALSTRLIEKDRLTRLGSLEWNRRSELQGWNLHGKVLGLIGCGAIGSELGSYARSLGMHVVAFDPALTSASAAERGIELLEFNEVLSRSDYISLHCPLNKSTRHLMDRHKLDLMKPGSCLINTARGGLVDQKALFASLSMHRLRAAALDVFEPEPLEGSEPLLTLDNVIFSAHALNWTHELDSDIADANVGAINALLQGAEPHKIANPAVLESHRYRQKWRNIHEKFKTLDTQDK